MLIRRIFLFLWLLIFYTTVSASFLYDMQEKTVTELKPDNHRNQSIGSCLNESFGSIKINEVNQTPAGEIEPYQQYTFTVSFDYQIVNSNDLASVSLFILSDNGHVNGMVNGAFQNLSNENNNDVVNFSAEFVESDLTDTNSLELMAVLFDSKFENCSNIIDSISVNDINSFFIDNTETISGTETSGSAEINHDNKYKFERMWPTLQQPWYFAGMDMALDSKKNIYIVDSADSSIKVFSSSGNFLSAYKTELNNSKMFDHPTDIAIDNEDNIYVVDRNFFIYKYNASFEFLTKWGAKGRPFADVMQDFSNIFIHPVKIGITSSNNIVIKDGGNKRIQVFNQNGLFLNEWYYSTENILSEGIFVDENDQIHLLLNGGENTTVKVFDINGVLSDLTKFDYPLLVGAVSSFHVKEDHYLVNGGKYDKEGRYLEYDERLMRDEGSAQQGSEYIDGEEYFLGIYSLSKYVGDKLEFKMVTESDQLGFFNGPRSLAIDSKNNLYVLDAGNQRIQKFSEDGKFLSELKLGTTIYDPQFTDMDIDENGNLYIVSSDYVEYDTQGEQESIFSVRIYNSNHVLINEFYDKWDLNYVDPGEDSILLSGGSNTIAVDGQYLYLSLQTDNKIAKYSKNGQLIKTWTKSDNQGNTLSRPTKVAIGPDNFVYVLDSQKVIKYDKNGEFIEVVVNIEEFRNFPNSIVFNNNYEMFVRTSQDIRKYDLEGNFISKIANLGSGPGSISFSGEMAIDDLGNLFVSDAPYNRVQKIKSLATIDNSKAIILAGGGPYPGNALWDATQMNANFAYRALTFQGYTKESIYYLSANTLMDLDNNGVLDDVDADATNANFKYAITEWAKDAENLVVYLVDHGGNETFRMSGTESLSVSELANWLNTWQTNTNVPLTIVYDACESGSFQQQLQGNNRIVITSTTLEESAYFLSQGMISFSNFFWSDIFNGLPLGEAFTRASEQMAKSTPYQNPQLDSNGNGVSNEELDVGSLDNYYIGSGTNFFQEAPVIDEISSPQTIQTNETNLVVKGVSDEDGIGSVWAVIRPPSLEIPTGKNPVLDLPIIYLSETGTGTYSGTYDGFTQSGTYHIAIYARDSLGNTSKPLTTTVSVGSARSNKAIIIAGGNGIESLWPTIENAASLAYEALKHQGFKDETIYYMSPISIAGVDVLPQLSNVEQSLTQWANQSTRDVVLYLVGQGNASGFSINGNETLTAGKLKQWLTNLESQITGTLTVVYDASSSGDFIEALKSNANQQRIIISSTSSNEPIYWLSDGEVSFSHFFWQQVANGSSVYNAFRHARVAMLGAGHGQTPLLDDNGNGVGNEKADGLMARQYSLGNGIMLAADEPLIEGISTQLSGNGQLTITAQNINTTNKLSRVWAVITTNKDDGQGALPSVELTVQGDGNYSGSYSLEDTVNYSVSVFALDRNGNISLPVTVTEGEVVAPEVASISAADIERLFEWAEKTYPQFFTPSGQSTFEVSGFTARHYPQTNTYLGFKDGQVYVYGDVFGGMLPVGSFASLVSLVD